MTDWRSEVYSRTPADLPQGWRSLRRKVVRRDNQKCQRCRVHLPYTRGQLHHVTPRSEGGDERLENLILLCEACHDRVEVADPPLRSRAAIQGSYMTYVDVYSEGEAYGHPEWHAVVYGGQRAAA